MGQRHQIFVVARVCVAPGERRQYRCIAALHHQWCYGRLPLEAVNSFKHLVRVPANAALVEEELATYCQRNADETSYPCPYTSLLAETAFNIDLVGPGGPYLSNHAVPLDVHMGSTHGDNNDGLTMMDVTTPLNPSYCFVWINRWRPLPIMMPLRAAQYLRSYSPAQENRSEIGDPDALEEEILNLGAIANLDDMPLIPKRTLGLVWPSEYGRFKDEELSSSLKSSLNSPNDLDVLRGQVSLSPEDVALLAKATREDLGDVVDLSRFPLTPSQPLSILGELGSFRRLDISYNQEVNKEVLINILKTFSDISWINVMHCPISRDDLVELAGTEPQIFRSIGGIIHPAFFLPTNYWWDNPPPFKAIDFPTAFRLGISTNSSSLVFEFTYLPFFRMDELVQNLTDLVELVQRHNMQYDSLHSSILASALRTAPDQGWQDRHIQLVPGSLDAKKYEPLKGCYEFLVWVSNLKDLRYGAFPPLTPGEAGHTVSDMMEVEEFLERLKEDGARPPSDGVAVERLVELCSKMKKLPMETSENPKKKW